MAICHCGINKSTCPHSTASILANNAKIMMANRDIHMDEFFNQYMEMYPCAIAINPCNTQPKSNPNGRQVDPANEHLLSFAGMYVGNSNSFYTIIDAICDRHDESKQTRQKLHDVIATFNPGAVYPANENGDDVIPKECKAVVAIPTSGDGIILWGNNMIAEDISNTSSSLEWFTFDDCPEDSGVYWFDGIMVPGPPEWESGNVEDWSYCGKFTPLDVRLPDGPVLLLR